MQRRSKAAILLVAIIAFALAALAPVLSGSMAGSIKTSNSTSSETTFSFPPPISITHSSTAVAATGTAVIVGPCNCTLNLNDVWQTYWTMHDLVSHSTSVIVGNVTSERTIGVNDTSLWGPNVGLVPVTDYNVTVTAVLADDGYHFGIDISAGYWTIVPQVGGTFGHTTMNVTGYPTLAVGASYVFFLASNAPVEGNLYNGLATTGGAQGLFYIQDGKVYSLDNMYPQADGWLPVKADGSRFTSFSLGCSRHTSLRRRRRAARGDEASNQRLKSKGRSSPAILGQEEDLKKEIESKAGVLRLKPNFVARTFYPGLNRLGLEDADAGERGAYVERWVASCVESASPNSTPNEGLSRILLGSSGSGPLLRDALSALPGQMLGENYARSHGNRFGALAKVLDIGYPIQWHIHARKDDAWRYWRSNPKDEAYFFLSHPNSPGPLPYSQIGMHPGTTPEEVLEPLKRWRDDKVLDLSPAYRLNTGEGFHVPSGVPHAPGTALTLELQEESDVYNMLQARYRGSIAPREDMLNGLPDEEAVVKLIDFETSTDPLFYRKFHTVPELVEGAHRQESWVFQPWRTKKFSGKELRVGPRKKARCSENGAHGILVWRGEGRVNASAAAAKHGLDEFFVTHGAATQGYIVENTGSGTLVLYKLFGPDVNV